MFCSHDHHGITESGLPTFALWKNQSFHFDLEADSTNPSPPGQREGAASSQWDEDGLGGRCLGSTDDNLHIWLWWRTAAGGDPLPHASADGGGGLTKRRFERDCCDTDFGPWASCEQRAT